MGKRHRSAALAAVHETALGLAEAGVMDKRTMKAFDAYPPISTVSGTFPQPIAIEGSRNSRNLRW